VRAATGTRGPVLVEYSAVTYAAELGPSRYAPRADRYEAMPYRRCGRSGMKLPAISLGLWRNFGDDRPLADSRAILRRAFDLGITHFDLANNYGPPYGSAEINFGRVFAEDFRPFRDELIISTKAGYDMWPGPYGEFGSRKYLLASLDQSLRRLGLDYVDIFYSHRFDPDTPLEETMGALDTAVRSGKARYAGISSYGAERTAEAARIMRDLGTPLLIHQPSYSMLNRWIERELLDVLEQEGIGAIVFSPLAQGLLTDRYLSGIRAYSRVRRGNLFSTELLTEENLRAFTHSTRSRIAAVRHLRSSRSRGRYATNASPQRYWERAQSLSSSRTSPPCSGPSSTPTSSPRSTATRKRARSIFGSPRAARDHGPAAWVVPDSEQARTARVSYP